MDLRDFDLNLLVVLHTLINERSVSNTAKKLHLSQPATSAALKRLRLALGDPILVREGLHMVPTPRAEQLAEPIQAILSAIEHTLTAPQPFDPSTINRTFKIATNDYGTFVLVPMLMQLGVSPDRTRAAYRVVDSPTNIITPLMPYFPLTVVFCQRYVRNAGIGTLASMMLPYSVTFLVAWTLYLLAYWAIGLPLGLQSTYTHP